ALWRCGAAGGAACGDLPAGAGGGDRRGAFLRAERPLAGARHARGAAWHRLTRLGRPSGLPPGPPLIAVQAAPLIGRAVSELAPPRPGGLFAPCPPESAWRRIPPPLLTRKGLPATAGLGLRWGKGCVVRRDRCGRGRWR